MLTSRSCISECSSSGKVISRGSLKTVFAYSKLTLCFRTFSLAFRSSHSKSSSMHRSLLWNTLYASRCH
jgi:hypothetical protein